MKLVYLSLLLILYRLDMSSETTVLTINNGSKLSVKTVVFDKELTKSQIRLSYELDGSLSDHEQVGLYVDCTNNDFIINVNSGNNLKTFRSLNRSVIMLISGDKSNDISNTLVDSKSLTFELEMMTLSEHNSCSISFFSNENTFSGIPIDIDSIVYLIGESKLFKINLYNKSAIKDLRRLRFQVDILDKSSQYVINTTLSTHTNSYMLNSFFENTLGGVLSGEVEEMCLLDCKYNLNFSVSGISSFFMEVIQMSEIAQMKVSRPFPYYNRAYSNDEILKYEFVLPSDFKLSDNLVITLTPVSSHVSLFVNPGFIPPSTDAYNWKVKGPNAKRLVISGNDIMDLRAGPLLYIAVVCNSPGEFLLQLEIFPKGFNGFIQSGIFEIGTVTPATPAHYLYKRYISSTEKVFFQVLVNVISGKLNIMSKKCSNETECIIQSKDDDDSYNPHSINDEVFKNHSVSETCEYIDSSSLCIIAIKVEAAGDQEAVYNISLVNENTPHIMSLGVPLQVNIEPDVFYNFKCSVSGLKSTQPIHLEITHYFGSFDVYYSSTNEFPTNINKDLQWSFTKTGGINYTNNVHDVEVTTVSGSPNGIYYFTIKSKMQTKLSVKLVHNDSRVETLMSSGKSERVVINNNHAFAQFEIQLPSDNETVQINFTPIKGQAILIASYGNVAPLREKNDFCSTSNVLVVPGGKNSTLMIEVLRADSMQFTGDLEGYLSYSVTSNWQVDANRGVIASAILSPEAVFYIELLSDSKSLTILKYSPDDYNINACMVDSTKDKKCLYKIEERESGLFLSASQLEKLRKDLNCNGAICRIKILVSGTNGEKISLGYTVDDLPFEASHGEAILGPKICHKDRPMHFVFKSLMSESTIYFKTKDPSTLVLSKIVKLTQNNNSLFPSISDYDQTVQERYGPVTLIRYPLDTILEMGNNFAIFVSVVSLTECKGDEDKQTGFHLQMITHNIEIPKHDSVTINTDMDIWYHFSLFSNSNNNSPVVTITSADLTDCDLKLSKGLYPGPPFNNTSLVDISTTLPYTLKTNIQESGHYTVSIKTTMLSRITFKWSDIDQFDFVELYNELPMTMTVRPGRPYYFTIYIPSVTKDEHFKLFANSSDNATIGLTKAKKVLKVPNKKDMRWNLSMGPIGGSFKIDIPMTDKNFCTDCTLLGSIESENGAEVTLLSDFHSTSDYFDLPSNLTIHDDLEPHQSIYYRIPCLDKEPVDLSVSVHFGRLDVFVAIKSSPKPGPSNSINQQSLNGDSDKHRFVSISSYYNGVGTHEFYFTITNTDNNKSRFGVTIYKNGRPSQIIGGVSREVYLGPLAKSSLYYKPNVKTLKSDLELIITLKQVISIELIPSILSNLESYVQVSGVNMSNEPVPVSIVASEKTFNALFHKFSVTSGQLSKILISLDNKSTTAVLLSVEIHDGEYRFLPLEEFLARKISKGKSMFLEVYGQKSSSLLLDLEVCSGEVDMSIQLSENEDDLKEQNFEEISKISSDKKNKMSLSSEVYKSIEMTKDRVFIKIQNLLSDKPSFFSIGAFHPRDTSLDNHTRISIGSKGRVRLEIDRNRISFIGVSFDSTYGNSFYHKVRYVLYVSDSFKVLKHLHNCGERFVNVAHPGATYHKTEIVQEYRDISINFPELYINIPKMEIKEKHHGILLAFIEIYSDDAGVLSPLRSRKIAYDDFVFIPPRMQVNLILMAMTLIIISIFGAISYLVKTYVFGNIGKINHYKKVEDFAKYEENVNSQIINSILEKDEEETHAVQEVDNDLRKRQLDKDIIINTLVAELPDTNK